MDELIESIRMAVADSATAEQKAAGAHACRTILTALEAEAGKPIALPGLPAPSPLAGIAPDQALDLLIAKLRVVASEREQAMAESKTSAPVGVRFPLVTPGPRTRPKPRGR